MVGWLLNDCLTCIPGTKTFWHDMLEWFPFIVDKTNTYTPFNILASYVENEIKKHGCPDFIIRNATFFRKIKSHCKTISFLQDVYNIDLRNQQIDVCNNSDLVVFNSPYTKSCYINDIKKDSVVIPIGTDFDIFRPFDDNEKEFYKKEFNILSDSILFIGSTNEIKGFEHILNLINTTNFNFCLIMKDDFKINKKNVRIFNKVDQNTIVKIINSCSLLVCSSVTETLHLSGIEAAACGLPLLTTNVGVYHGLKSGEWGLKVEENNFLDGIKYILDNKEKFRSRNFFLDMGLDKESCKRAWTNIIFNL